MSTMEQRGGKWAAALFLGVVLPAVAAAQAPKAPPAASPQQGTKTEGSNQAAGKEEGESGVKVFHLQHADPQEVQQALTQLWRTLAPVQESARANPRKPRGGAEDDSSSPGIAPPRVAVEPRTRTMFMRGSEKALDLASEVVEALDAEPGKEAPKLKDLAVFQVRGGTIDEVVQVLTALDLTSHIFVLKKSSTLIVPQGPYVKDVSEVLEHWGERPGGSKTATKDKSEDGKR